MSGGKGSNRRPTQVSDAEAQANWDRIFGKKENPTPDNSREQGTSLDLTQTKITATTTFMRSGDHQAPDLTVKVEELEPVLLDQHQMRAMAFGTEEHQSQPHDVDKPDAAVGSVHQFHWHDIWFSAIATVAETRVKIKIYEIEGYSGNHETIYWKALDSNGTTDDITQAKVFMDADVKWDGCSNWLINEMTEGVYSHCCSREDVVHLGEMLKRCFDISRELVPSWKENDD